MTEVAAYRVEVYTEGCEHCGAGKMWIILDNEDLASSVTYGDENEANYQCWNLNEAFARGAKLNK